MKESQPAAQLEEMKARLIENLARELLIAHVSHQVQWIDARLGQLVKYPKMWGSNEAVEMQALTLLDLRATFACNAAAESPRLSLDFYAKTLQKKFGKLQPLHLIPEAPFAATLTEMITLHRERFPVTVEFQEKPATPEDAAAKEGSKYVQFCGHSDNIIMVYDGDVDHDLSARRKRFLVGEFGAGVIVSVDYNPKYDDFGAWCISVLPSATEDRERSSSIPDGWRIQFEDGYKPFSMKLVIECPKDTPVRRLSTRPCLAGGFMSTAKAMEPG